jgi:hypothetical protein
MFAFLRSNLYPASINQQPELKSRLDAIRFSLVSNTIKIRANVKQGKLPLSDIETDEAGNVNVAALAEIMLKELRFCRRTIAFITSVTTKFHETAFDNTDRYIEEPEDLESQKARDEEENEDEEGEEGEEGEEEEEEEMLTSEQNHSARLLSSANDIRCRFITLCTSLGVRTAALSELDDCTASTDATLFAAIHESLSSLSSSIETIATPFETLCSISRAAWQMMNVLAFSNLYRYHYEFQKGPITRIDLNPSDSVFATR